MREKRRSNRFLLLTLLVMAMIVNTGCGGGGGGGPVATTGGTVTVNDGVPIAGIAGVVQTDPQLTSPLLSPVQRQVATPSHLPVPVQSVGVSIYADGLAVVQFPNVVTDEKGFFFIPLYSVKHASFIGKTLDIVLTGVNFPNTSVSKVSITPQTNQTAYSVIYVANQEVKAAIRQNVTTNQADLSNINITSRLQPGGDLAPQPNTSTGLGMIEGVLDVPLEQVKISFVGSGVLTTTPSNSAAYLEAVASSKVDHYGYRIHNVPAGKNTVNAELISATVTVNPKTVIVAENLSTVGVNFDFQQVSNDLVLQKVSGDLQTGTVATLLQKPLVINVLQNGGPAVNVGVTFRVINGSAALSGQTVNTDVNGQARINVTLGNVIGPLQIMALLTAYPGQTTTFTIQVVPAIDPQGRPTALLDGAEASSKTLVLRYSELVQNVDQLASYRISVNSESFQVLPGNTILSFNTVTLELLLTLPSTFNLPAGATVQLALYNVQDLAGNPTEPATDYRTNILTVTDNLAPTASIESAQASTDVVVILFSEDVNGADVINHYLLARNDGSFVPLSSPASVTYNSDTLKARIVLNGTPDLQDNDTVVVKIYDVTDKAGNALGTASGFLTNSFAVSQSDITPPAAVILSADDYSKQIVIQYSEDVNADSANSIGNYQLIQAVSLQLNPSLASVTYNNTSLKATIILTGLDLAAGTTFSVRILNMQDLAGNAPAMNPFETSSFTVADLKPPTAEIIEATDLNQNIVVQFSEPMTGASMYAGNFSLSLDGGSTWRALLYSYFSSYTYDPATYRLTMVASNTIVLAGGQSARLKMNNVQDANGNYTSPQTGYLTNVFSVAETVTDPPEASITDASDRDQKITLTFNKRMNQTIVTNKANYMVSRDNGSTWVPLSTKTTASLSYNDTDKTLAIHYPELSFSTGNLIRVLLSNIQDTAGRTTVPAINYEIGPFTARDTTPPTATIITAYIPTQTVVIQFSEPVTGLSTSGQQDSQIEASLTSTDSFNYKFFNATTYDSTTNRVTIVNLDPSRGGTFQFTQDDQLAFRFYTHVKDLAGNTGDSVYIVTNRVRPAEVSAPYATLLSARDFQQEIIMQFSKPMDSSNLLTPTNYYVKKNSNGYILLSSNSIFSYDAATYRLQIIVNDGINFQSGDQVYVKMDNLKDLSTPALTTVPATGYETDPITAVDTSPPTAAIVSAKDGDQRVVMQWSEDVSNSLTISNYQLSLDGGSNWYPVTAASSFASGSTSTTPVILLESSLAITGGQSLKLRISNVTDLQSSPTVPSMNYEIGPYTVLDTTLPTITIHQVREENNDNTMVLQASEPLDPVTATNLSCFTWIGNPLQWYLGDTLSQVSYDADNRRIQLLLGSPITFTTGDTVTIQINSNLLKDLAGNAVHPIRLTATVTDGKAPDVQSGTASATSKQIILTFDEPIATVTASNFKIDGLAPSSIEWVTTNPAVVTLNTGTLTTGSTVTVTMDNVKDTSGNYTIPRIAKTYPLTVQAQSTNPTATIIDSSDFQNGTVKQTIRLQFSSPVGIFDGTWDTPITSAHKKYFYISKNNGLTYTRLDDPALNVTIVSTSADRKIYDIEVDGISFKGGDILRVKMDNVQYMALPTIPAFGYETPPQYAKDTTPPVATLVSASLANQTLVISWSEPVRRIDNLAVQLTNFWVSRDGGATYNQLFANDGPTPAESSSLTHDSNGPFLIKLSSLLPFTQTDTIQLKIYNVADVLDTYTPVINPMLNGTETNSVVPTDDVKPVAKIVYANDATQVILVRFSENIGTFSETIVQDKNRYLYSKAGGAGGTWLPLINSTVDVPATSSITSEEFVALNSAGWGITTHARSYARITISALDAGYAFSAGDLIMLTLNNMNDANGNFTDPQTNYTVGKDLLNPPTAYPADDRTVPSVAVTSAVDSTQTIRLGWTEEVTGADVITNYIFVKNGIENLLTTATSIAHSNTTKTTTLVIEPAFAFTAGDTLILRLRGVEDLHGNQLGTNIIWSGGSFNPNVFNTSIITVTDQVGPTVDITYAKDYDDLYGLPGIRVSFTEEVSRLGLADPLLVTNWDFKKNNGSWLPLASSGANEVGFQWITVSPTVLDIKMVGSAVVFKGGDLLQLRVRNVKDVSPNANPTTPDPYVLPAFVAQDQTKPTAVLARVTDGNQQMVIRFSENVRGWNTSDGVATEMKSTGGVFGATNGPAFYLLVKGGAANAANGGYDLWLRDGSGLGAGSSSFAWDSVNNEMTITMDPAAPAIFAGGDSLMIKFTGVGDLNDNNYNTTFYTTAATIVSDTTPPGATLIQAGDNDTLRIQFTEAVNTTDAEDLSKYLVAIDTPPSDLSYTLVAGSSTATYDAVNKWVDINLSGYIDLIGGQNVAVIVSSMRDTTGNVSGSLRLPTAGFVVVTDTEAPTVSTVEVRGTSIIVTYSEAMTIGTGAFETTSIQKVANYSLTIDGLAYPLGSPSTLVTNGSKTVTFENALTWYFPYGSTYTLTISNVEDVAGNAILSIIKSGTIDSQVSLASSSALFNGPSGLSVCISNSLQAIVSQAGGHNNLFYNNGPVLLASGTGVAGINNSVPGNSKFDTPGGVTAVINNNYFVADTNNHCVRRHTTSDTIVTLAGSTEGDGDGTEAAGRFRYPQGVCLSNDGLYVYVADTGNHLIRKVEISTQVVTTVAGDRFNVDLSGNITSGFKDDPNPLNAWFKSPTALCFDDDTPPNLYIVDTGNHAIRKIDGTTGAVTTVAGAGTPGFNTGVAVGNAALFNTPRGITYSPLHGALYVADSLNNRVRRINLSDNSVTTVAGSGQSTVQAVSAVGTAATFGRPSGIGWSWNLKALFVVEQDNNLLKKILP